MRALLDTHAMLWMVADDPRLSTKARRAIQNAEELYWSVASLWEIGIKVSLGRDDFQMAKGWEEALAKEMERNGILRLAIEPGHCGVVAALPWHHRDPFDRMLVGQAKVEKLVLISRDERLDDYKVKRIW